MDQRHPYKIIIYSILFLFVVLLLLFFFGSVNFDYIFDFKWSCFDFYYSVLVYWYGLFGYQALIFGVFVTLCCAVYALFFNVRLTRRVFYIFIKSYFRFTGCFFYHHKFINFGFVGESFGWLFRYYLGVYAKVTMFFSWVYLFLLFPFRFWRRLFFILVQIIIKSKVIFFCKYLWNNFLGFMYFFNKKNKNIYIDDLIKQSIDRDFRKILLKYPNFADGDQVLLNSCDFNGDFSYAELYIKKYGIDQYSGERQKWNMSNEELSVLVEGLNHFHISGVVEQVFRGPYLNTVIFTPDKTVKMNLIFKVQDDLARLIGRPDLRIVYPVKDYVYSLAIEYAHYDKFDFYFLPYFLDSRYLEFEPLIILLGLDSLGDPFYFDLKQAPHMLIAGTTGSGKSTILNSIIFNLIWKYRQKDIDVYLIDPKVNFFI